MNTYPTAPHAWSRTRLMARSLGVDLPRAVFDGWLTRRDLDRLVSACAACGQSSCRATAMTPPTQACSNRADLVSLRF